MMDYQKAAERLSRLLDEFFKDKGKIFEAAATDCLRSLRAGGKILVFGNGGSAAEAQHFAAELVNRFLKNRPALRAVALSTDTSVLTSIGNDSGFDRVFSRQVEALAKKGDVALALSTSGNSPNVINALKAAKKKKLVTIAMTGKGGGKMARLPDHLLDVASSETPRIQEAHLFLLHLLAEEIETRMCR
jgi:D-sedoheptulose 7-phosphate isomerase